MNISQPIKNLFKSKKAIVLGIFLLVLISGFGSVVIYKGVTDNKSNGQVLSEADSRDSFTPFECEEGFISQNTGGRVIESADDSCVKELDLFDEEEEESIYIPQQQERSSQNISRNDSSDATNNNSETTNNVTKSPTPTSKPAPADPYPLLDAFEKVLMNDIKTRYYNNNRLLRSDVDKLICHYNGLGYSRDLKYSHYEQFLKYFYGSNWQEVRKLLSDIYSYDCY